MAVHRLGSKESNSSIIPQQTYIFCYHQACTTFQIYKLLEIDTEERLKWQQYFKIISPFLSQGNTVALYIYHPIKHPFLPGKVDVAQREYVKNTLVIGSTHFHMTSTMIIQTVEFVGDS